MERPDRSSSGVAVASRSPGASGVALARFSEARGYPVFEAGGALWARGVTTRHLFDRLPLQSIDAPDLRALRRGLRAAPGVGALYAAQRGGVRSGLYVLRASDYALEGIPDRERRRQIRRGLERADLRWVAAEALLDGGLELNRQTMARQGRYDPELGERSRWRRFVRAAGAVDLTCAAAFVEGRLAAYALACRDGAWLHVRYRMATDDALAKHVVVALDHWMLTEVARDPAIELVSQGFVPVGAAAAGLHGYKRSFGFEVVPVGRVLELHPFLRPVLASGLALRAAGLAARVRPRDRRFETLSTLLRGASPRAEICR